MKVGLLPMVCPMKGWQLLRMSNTHSSDAQKPQHAVPLWAQNRD